ncbi:MAG: hypothetical protein NC082_02640 [Clostridiales bacterium]|nr:hypothetical protein [Clostridiales bacterium]
MKNEDNRFREIEATRYDPVSGKGSCGERVRVKHPDGKSVYIPKSMRSDPEYKSGKMDSDAFDRLRSRHDFEYWCATCCHVRDKSSGRVIPFILNTPQRFVTEKFEIDRIAGLPLRFIMLKARQWGGSTLVQMYMAWIQCTGRKNWNSLICAHVKDTASTIRGMYSEMLASYPRAMWLGEEGSEPSFRPFERALNVREIPGRGCRVTVGSSENHEAVRGADYAMAHLSEVAFWADTPLRTPGQLVRAVCGSINLQPLTLIVMESTANGVGNYFHREWLRACAGESDKRPVFIPWYFNPLYATPADDESRLLESLDDYERQLIDEHGCSMAQVNWYHMKRKEYPDHAMMKAEYPTTDIEAFTHSGYQVFNNEHIDRLRNGCTAPMATGDFTGCKLTGEESLSSMKFTPSTTGAMKVWRHPVPSYRTYESPYIVCVDVGGRSHKSDFSVIAVFDRLSSPGCLEVVAQWRGHCDHDVLAWKAAAIARHYHNALLVYESNTLECDNTEGDPSLFILNEISCCYDNLYYRSASDSARGEERTPRPGFHTNRATKTAAITRLVAALRDGLLIERDPQCCNELATYEYLPNGSQGARNGHHDDIIITRAIAMTVAAGMSDTDIYSMT